MEITKNVNVVRKTNGTYLTNINGVETVETDTARISQLDRLYWDCRNADAYNRPAIYNDLLSKGLLDKIIFNNSATINLTEAEAKVLTPLTPQEILERGLGALIDFFKEFQFEPNFRFVNTLAYKVAKTNSEATDYISRYFELIDSPYVSEVAEKMKSKEFKAILADIKKGGKPTNTVNTRFKIYYGSAGTGKTTLAMTESDNRCVVCNNSMLPADLMEDFCFTDGKPDFKPSALWECIINGKPIVLDEINLLPFDSLRFLQGILDGKKEFIYKGRTIEIADGFMVIGTMNLAINGMVYGLPEPLVDRSADMQKFSLDASTLARAILPMATAAPTNKSLTEEVKVTDEYKFNF